MVIILVIIAALARLEEEVTCHHLENGASERPNVGRGVIVSPDDNLGRPVLTRLDFWCEVMIGPAPITHVTDLDLDIITDSRASPKLFLLGCFVLLMT